MRCHLQAVAIALPGRDEMSNSNNYLGNAGYRLASKNMVAIVHCDQAC